MELPAGQVLDDSFTRQLSGLDIAFLPNTAVALPEDQIRIDADVTDPAGVTQRWYVVLVENDETYRIANTTPVP